MCTVSFSPNSCGFHLLMNRDEKRSREAALSPETVDLGQCRAIYPREPNGGSWIAANDAGVCLALINWHRIEREPLNKIVSRGQIVIELAGSLDSHSIAAGLTNLRLIEFRPFRLIAIVPREKSVIEWRWDLERLSQHKYPWSVQHWFSSGFDEAKAESARRRVCGEMEVNGIDHLRQLHRSHAPERGPFSICMHRADAATVSYTEVSVEDRKVTMRYKPGPPCSTAPAVAKSL
jgi:hypothetical protein